MGSQGAERTGPASTWGRGGAWPGLDSGSPDFRPHPSLLSPASWFLVLGATPIWNVPEVHSPGFPHCSGPTVHSRAPLNPSPRFHRNNKKRLILLHPDRANARPWPQAIFVGGYQRDLEIQFRKPATRSAEIDTCRAPVTQPERGWGGRGDPGRGNISWTGRLQGSHPVRAAFLPQTPLPRWACSARKDALDVSAWPDRPACS